MSAPYGMPAAVELAPAAAPLRRPDPSDARVAVFAAVLLAVLGALLGLVWSLWSPSGPAAEVLGGGRFAVLEESESAIAGDGRYLVIVAAVGLVAALGAWFGLKARRGATMLFGLVAGAAAGALLTELVGHLTGGGSFSGKLFNLTDGTRREVTLHLPLSLHLSGLVVIEPAVIALVYGVLVAFTEHDDLARPDPVRDLLRPPPAGPLDGQPYGQQPYAPQAQYPPPQPQYPSVHPGDHPQYGGGDGDAPGATQQRDLPPQ